MKPLTGESEPQRGTVVRPKKLGVLRQDQFTFDGFRVLDVVITVVLVTHDEDLLEEVGKEHIASLASPARSSRESSSP